MVFMLIIFLSVFSNLKGLNLLNSENITNIKMIYGRIMMVDRKQIAMDFAESLDYLEIEKIILFGSVARMEDKKNSDIDILIIAKDKYKVEDEIYSKAFNIYLNDDEDISVILLSTEDYKYNENSDFIANIEKEGILIG
ncbi:nucleotidyltransferase domain protein [Methanobrevibacter cuticularis]|uniref:protein adenylyltransferase n=2 Tax=Methanobrevibacter cuticularis TaxID=47311 RepID=A0A166DLA5_9EURY|nr:nucleotidyltransferase domain protein [Methanobrevibacter cuticularis]